MHDGGFLLFGCQVLTNVVGLDHIDKVTYEQREAAIVAMHEIHEKRLKATTLIITKTQVVAIPDLAYDLKDHIAVADLRGILFLSRKNRMDGR